MAWWNPFQRAETRAIGIEQVYGSRENWLLAMGGAADSEVVVSIETALQVPAFTCAVMFIAETVASLPLDYYRRKRDGSREEGKGPLVALLKDAAHDTLPSFEWRRGEMVKKLTGGRGLTYVERNERGQPINFFPLDPAKTKIVRDGFANSYQFEDGGRQVIYSSDEVIDLPFMLKADGYSHRSPVSLGAKAIGKALAAMSYGEKFFNGGGVPPFVITGPTTPGGLQRAADDMDKAVRKAKGEKRLALALPPGHEIKQLGTDPEKAQMVESLRFSIEEIARLFKIPPVFLQDLTHGTFSNTEQQDLHFVKHTLLHHVKQFEQELNLKLFGRANRSEYVEFNVDGIMRGDFKTRMEGWARGVQTGIVTPNEARRAENYPDMPGGDELFMQGATVPIDQASPEPAPQDGSQGQAV